MKAKTIELDKAYYYARVQRKMVCTKVGTGIDGLQSNFTDYLGNKYQFYNEDMFTDRYSSK